ncbi:heavy-metal-associated domain-containing protein [Lutibacter sp.]|uniref:heavy-metal-associated domain-containing protein n=1 Tax=Lutibacter sp. TaxID=1925666 RepID=UPI0025C23289|nr:heavy-metal-associated domain-containing protein [Lutibacter sp.]MCF6182211.1 heavy-metal-associated domain-containing protein [Lutibacter sp.]
MKKLLKTVPFFGLIFTILLFGQHTTINAQNNSDHVFIKMEVNGMACPYCAYGMEKELKKVSGIDDVKIQLKEGIVFLSILKEKKPSKENLSSIITNAGFTPGEIEYSDKPYPIRDTSKE